MTESQRNGLKALSRRLYEAGGAVLVDEIMDLIDILLEEE